MKVIIVGPNTPQRQEIFQRIVQDNRFNIVLQNINELSNPRMALEHLVPVTNLILVVDTLRSGHIPESLIHNSLIIRTTPDRDVVLN